MSKNFADTPLVLLSAGRNQRAWEDAELGHGLFTCYLVEALKSAASDEDGYVSVRQAYLYVLESVEKRSRLKFDSLQSPVISSEHDPAFVLAITKPPPHPLRATALQSMQQAFESAKKSSQATIANALEGRTRAIQNYNKEPKEHTARMEDTRSITNRRAYLLSVVTADLPLKIACGSILAENAGVKSPFDGRFHLMQNLIDNYIQNSKKNYPPEPDWNELEKKMLSEIDLARKDFERWNIGQQKEDNGRFCPPERPVQ